MNKGIYGITDTKISDIKLLTVKEACTIYKMSRNTLMKVARDNNAVVKIGRSVRIMPKEMDAGLNLYKV